MAGRQAKRRNPEATAPSLGPLVVCIDGPMKNQWYTDADWRERVEASRYMAARGQRRSPCLDYVPGTGPPLRNPDQVSEGKPLQYRPKEHA
jgi:hypothetical protein